MILPLLLLGLSARAADLPDYDREKLDVLGWGDGCSVAVADYGLPPDGAAISDPLMVRVGTLTLPPGRTKEVDDWIISLHGVATYRPKEVAKALASAASRGFTRSGMTEPVGLNPVVPVRDLPRIINTTDVLKVTPGRPWPGRDWRWTEMIYEPLATCALFVYEARGVERPYYNYLLVRIDNPAGRGARAQAHVENALLLFERGNLDAALSESAIAAAIDPTNASARYHHAAFMALSGDVEPAVDELAASIALDPKYKAKARADKDLETLRWHPRFKEMTR